MPLSLMSKRHINRVLIFDFVNDAFFFLSPRLLGISIGDFGVLYLFRPLGPKFHHQSQYLFSKMSGASNSHAIKSEEISFVLYF